MDIARNPVLARAARAELQGDADAAAASAAAPSGAALHESKVALPPSARLVCTYTRHVPLPEATILLHVTKALRVPRLCW